jgi:Zn-dependent peptidase ImmA (M78 family)
MPHYTDENLEEIARIIRVDVELDDEIKLDVIEFLRRLKRHGYIADYVRVPDQLMRQDEAKYVAEERKIYVREGVYTKAEDWADHERFTIIHEAAHAVLNHQHERKRSFSAQAALERKVWSIGRDETEANRLAAAIIAPFHRANFSLDTTILQLMERFGLSSLAATARIETLSRIYRRRHNIPRPLPAGVVDFLAKQRREGYQVTSLPDVDVVALRVRKPVYTGDACPLCGAFKMIRVGLHMKCDSETCGARTGDD